ncbi:tRNA (N6-threonylcarbamoyladenosine(37)-N6)-methyltransferase TrmO [Moraxella marmotae]|uniref:tRNA (N6-threonylcarbamoyladenosine(37)-N6)-methyltransferase TrmO n=1 Tax=Moraxella marmotae TaxID=3344520 RepID=UPI0035F25015
MTMIHLPVIGRHHSPLTQKFGIPRQPNLVNVASTIEFIAPYDTPAAFVGIEQYSHLWIVWQFHQNRSQDNFRPQVRPPRFGGNAKMGVFATRSMYRPSALGLSVVRLHRLEIDKQRVRLHIIGADMVDGTPIVDIKPYLPFVDSVPQAVCGTIDTPPIRTVRINQQAMPKLNELINQGNLTQTDLEIIQNLIAQDPRPAYRQGEIDTPFTLRYAKVDIDFTMLVDGVMDIVGFRLIDA